MEDTVKILKSLEDSSILVKVVTETETTENETKERRRGFLGYVIRYIRCKFFSEIR